MMVGIIAYIGPGAGVSLIGALIALVSSIGFALLMMAAYPIRMFLKKRAASADASPDAIASPPTPQVSSTEPVANS